MYTDHVLEIYKVDIFVLGYQIQFTPGGKSLWGLAQECVEYENSIQWAWWYGLVRTTSALAYMLYHLSTAWSQFQMSGWSPRWKWVLIWYIAVEYQRLSFIRVIFVDYQTSKLLYNYWSYIQVGYIGDT